MCWDGVCDLECLHECDGGGLGDERGAGVVGLGHRDARRAQGGLQQRVVALVAIQPHLAHEQAGEGGQRTVRHTRRRRMHRGRTIAIYIYIHINMVISYGW